MSDELSSTLQHKDKGATVRCDGDVQDTSTADDIGEMFVGYMIGETGDDDCASVMASKVGILGSSVTPIACEVIVDFIEVGAGSWRSEVTLLLPSQGLMGHSVVLLARRRASVLRQQHLWSDMLAESLGETRWECGRGPGLIAVSLRPTGVAYSTKIAGVCSVVLSVIFSVVFPVVTRPVLT